MAPLHSIRGRWTRRACFLLCLLPGGCASKGTVSGKITYQGQPLPSGTVLFVPENGPAVSGVISNGRYEVRGVVRGTARIGVQVPENVASAGPGFPPEFRREIPQGMGPPKDAALPPGVDPSVFDPAAQRSNLKTVWIPEDYRDPEKSGLKCTVEGGAQEHDIELP
jgi:hypothetical protein